MILHDYECELCGEVTEFMISDSNNIPKIQHCPICNGDAYKIVSMSQTSPVDAAWIGTVLEVVDKDSDKPHCKEFLKHPSRANYKNWMKGEGLRPLEPGERTMPKPIDKKARRARVKDKMMKRFKERNAVAVN